MTTTTRDMTKLEMVTEMYDGVEDTAGCDVIAKAVSKWLRGPRSALAQEYREVLEREPVVAVEPVAPKTPAVEAAAAIKPGTPVRFRTDDGESIEGVVADLPTRNRAYVSVAVGSKVWEVHIAAADVIEIEPAAPSAPDAARDVLDAIGELDAAELRRVGKALMSDQLGAMGLATNEVLVEARKLVAARTKDCEQAGDEARARQAVIDERGRKFDSTSAFVSRADEYPIAASIPRKIAIAALPVVFGGGRISPRMRLALVRRRWLDTGGTITELGLNAARDAD